MSPENIIAMAVRLKVVQIGREAPDGLYRAAHDVQLGTGVAAGSILTVDGLANCFD
jgi:hypothetical protein